MLNKIASKYLEKVANPILNYDPMMSNANNFSLGISPEQYQKQGEVAVDIFRNIPKGLGTTVLEITNDTLRPAGKFGYKAGARIMSPIMGIPGLWNGKGYINQANEYIKSSDDWADVEYDKLAAQLKKDQQDWDNYIPTTTEAGKWAHSTGYNAGYIGLGKLIPGTHFSRGLKAAVAGKGLLTRIGATMLRPGAAYFDFAGLETIGSGLVRNAVGETFVPEEGYYEYEYEPEQDQSGYEQKD
jgi:hypothetical protein